MSPQAVTSTPEVVNDQLKMKRHTEEVQSEQENKKIDAHMPLAKKGLCNSEL